MEHRKTYQTAEFEAGVNEDLRSGPIGKAFPRLGAAAADAAVEFFRSVPHHGKQFDVRVEVMTEKDEGGQGTGQVLGFGVAVMASPVVVEEPAPAPAAAEAEPDAVVAGVGAIDTTQAAEAESTTTETMSEEVEAQPQG
jgi:hypothetical protein